MNVKRCQQAFAAIDKINRQDPNTLTINNESVAKELIYGHQMTACLNKYWPEANECLQVAVRAQHVKRWYIARTEYPEGKQGYLTWRKDLGKMHADIAKKVMLEHGYNEQEAEHTAKIIRKEKLKRDQDSQTLEDVACLVFLQHYFAPFAEKHSDEKVISILQKTWRKMSAQGQDIALTFTLPSHLAALVNKALT
ncbi:DUF4202 domain-containing protein [Thalassotalea sp. 1_MG-2023]|uniref:DUF4202 domain-containing protein n=1 Tax=Thalassotalea sp. 1_MG-2023 TaxID=3062680 RepID=UPI0026E1309B|nr:DUF4202 domain-containing protein [Thalassotalea sp. 1_MG-2023]MDO6428111.1 DUF4202 domain-containing protein [Thalassotalea sp. 1_MG-2023]